jgi:hypothetical protein
MGRIIEFDPTRGPLGPIQPDPDIYLQYVTRTARSPTSFFAAPIMPDLITIYPSYSVIITCFS